MGIAALILGIVSLVVACIPLCGAVALFPGLVGLTLGIVDIAVKSRRGLPKALGIVGTVLNALALLVAVLWVVMLIIGAAEVASDPDLREDLMKKIEEAQRQQQNRGAGQGRVVVETVEVKTVPLP